MSDPSFERFARLVRRQLDVPVALVTFVSAEEQVLPGALGLPEPWQSTRRTPLTHSFCQHVVLSAQPLVITDARTHPLVRDNLAIPDLGVVAYAGMPLTDADGAVVGSLCAIDSRPRTWTQDDLEVLADLADACSSEVQLRTTQQRGAEAAARAEESSRESHRLLAAHELDQSRWAMALGAGQVGTFDLDLTTGVLDVDDRLLELSAMTRQTFSGHPDDVYAHVHPDDLDAVVARVQDAITRHGGYDAEYRIVLPDGGHRWLAARGEVVGGEGQPRLLGVVLDITARRGTLELAAQTLQSMAVGYLAMDADWRVTYLNAEGERLAGHTSAELVGRDFWTAFPATVGGEFEASYRRAAATGEPVAFDAYYPAPLNIWVEVRANPEHGGVALYFTDITARVRLQQHTDLLAEVGQQLSGTLDTEHAVAQLARLVVPALAEWAVVTLVDDDSPAGSRRGLRDVGWWHPDPGLRAVVADYAQHRIAALRETSFLSRALTTGRTITLPSGAADAIRAISDTGPVHERLAELAPESFAVLPLRGRGRTVGLLSLFNGPSRAPMSTAELRVAEDVAGRAGLALDNARLYRQQQQLSEGLQRSLLTAPAQPDHMQIVVRYTPAAETAQVGGDWYDAFLQPEGTTIITIGDVLGHNTAAAAAMGQIRSMLRGIAVTTSARPAEIITRVDEAMTTLMDRSTATAVVLRLEQPEEQAAEGLTTVRWSNAGHPPPLVLDADGTTRLLSAPRADLLLGVDHTVQRREHEVVLGQDAVLLLYTDGLIERRDSDLDAGLERLQHALVELVPSDRDDLDLDELCDGLLARMLPPEVDDDVAIVALRLQRQDRPRPSGAGPNRIPRNVSTAPDVIPTAAR
ncbi:SpoIIE family protein phosphatase [Modestobacter excelsi]|uniref:SpoIIE family protein phosphatase n=1 Tax=Modestobacter excelsi TaxID=2213161 RepID=UPI001FE810B2|nr:SpoIIE family protein phosphatase [Modestobacter excelsi]